jgi:hypothetical protein
MIDRSNLEDVPKTRAEALAAGSKKYVPEKPCARGHVGEWYADRGRCCECAKENAGRNYRANRQARINYCKSYIERNPDSNHKAHLKRAFGISYETYQEILAAQFGRCGNCGTSDPQSKKNRWHVDHCHSTQKIRGILCGPCNLMLGWSKDNPATLLSGVDYLNGRKAPGYAMASALLSFGA